MKKPTQKLVTPICVGLPEIYLIKKCPTAFITRINGNLKNLEIWRTKLYVHIYHVDEIIQNRRSFTLKNVLDVHIRHKGHKVGLKKLHFHFAFRVGCMQVFIKSAVARFYSTTGISDYCGMVTFVGFRRIQDQQ